MAATIAKVSARGAKKYYYEKDPVFNENGTGENLEWSGKQAEFLGLEGMATKEEFGNLLEGKNKDGSVQLKENKNEVAALDLTFSAPKSVSILALNGDEKLIEAHKKAVDKALSYAEQNFANAKVWKGEGENRQRVVENQGNLLIAKALHSTNRNQDPHLHTHSLIFNQVFVKSEGKFKALAAQELFRNQKTLDNIYKSELAKEVTKLGYKLEKTENGGWEIAIKQELKEEFSSRRQEILAKAKETGAQTVKEKVHIQHMLKAEKTDITKEELLKNWENTINKHYNSKEEMFQEAKGYQKIVNEDGEEKLIKEEREQQFSSAKEVLEYTGKLLSENEAVWSEKDLLEAATSLAGGEYTYLDLKNELDNVKKIGQKEGYELKRLDKNNFTNKEMYELEKENINMLKNQKNFGALMSKEEATKALASFEKEYFKLNEGQYNTVFNLLTSTDQYSAIQGVAGAGKTTMLKAFNYSLAYKNKDMIENITLLAPTNKAASGAMIESRVGDKAFNAQTVSKHVIEIKKKEGTLGKEENKKEGEISQNPQKISHVKFGEENKKENKKLSSSDFTAKNKKILTEAELYVKSGHSVFNKDSRTFLLNAANSFGIKLNKNLEGVYITKARNKITRQTKINRGEFKGAVKKEEIKFRGDSISYRSDITFKDGSKYQMSVENWNGANKLMSVLFNVKSTNITDTNKNERLKQTDINLTALKLTRKAVDKQNAQQRKTEISLAGLAKASINKTNFKLKNGLEKTQTAKKLGILGFSITTIREELKDKEGNTISLKTQKEKKFLGFTIKKETEVKNIRDNKADLKISNEIKEEKISHVKFQDKNKKIIEEKSTQEFKDVNKEKALKITEDNAKIQKSEKMIIIDEASMLSARDLNKILKDAQRSNIRVVFMGDTRQLQSIGAGRAFEQIQKHTKTSIMNESLRQHTQTDKTIADNARDAHTIIKSFKEIEENNRVHDYEITKTEKQEIKDEAKKEGLKGEDLKKAIRTRLKELAQKKKEDMLKAAAQAAVREETLKGTKFGKEYEKTVNYKDNLILANTRAEVEKLNSYVRKELKNRGILKEEESFKAKVVEQKNMSAIKQANAANFREGQIVQTFHTNQSKMKIGKEYEIVDINKIKNTLILKELNNKDNKTIEVNVKELAGKFAVQERKSLEIAKNDIVVVTKTDKQQGINNSDRGIVLNIDRENQKIKIDFGDKGVKEIDLSKGNIGLDHGYALTTYKSQGVSVDRVQAIVTKKFKESEKINNLNSFYVAASRQKLKFELFTNGYEKIKEEVKKLQQKTSTLDFQKITTDLQKQHTQNLNNLIKQVNTQKEGINTQTQQKLQKLAQNAQKQQSQKNPEKQGKVGFETENKQNQENVKNQEQQAKNARIQAF